MFDFSACGWHDGACAPFGSVDPAWSMLMGAQINRPNFNSTGAWASFGPWEQSAGMRFVVQYILRVYS